MVSSALNILALTCAIRGASAAFSLNTGGPNWDYTTKDLASTTSQACKDAYSASIDCNNVLVGMAASLNPNFDVGASDLQNLCTTTCSDSLAHGNKNLFQAPVEAAGEYLQYKYGEACAMNGSQDWARETFPCNDTCAIQFYQNAHDQPGSAYLFSYMDLCNQTSYWEETFAGGWDTLGQYQRDGLGENFTRYCFNNDSICAGGDLYGFVDRIGDRLQC
ncbi:uncharacterized protein BHQ10_006861 [Talaromyces amestolkiae]|uniref:WSC domain-containing protein n=1 Tax=Talaromyces amestolkiae TaxID=1196081 RepID=A0A364L4W0_TALAM|nr:uncharacterized protein BHQ10_006861 [Talaromyces amestolkiae]RAO70849.1 hypothetical protein BHQ10_006861 [Talaromyces amestolkiae]